MGAAVQCLHTNEHPWCSAKPETDMAKVFCQYMMILVTDVYLGASTRTAQLPKTTVAAQPVPQEASAWSLRGAS